jgi:hypothetical protein
MALELIDPLTFTAAFAASAMAAGATRIWRWRPVFKLRGGWNAARGTRIGDFCLDLGLRRPNGGPAWTVSVYLVCKRVPDRPLSNGE